MSDDEADQELLELLRQSLGIGIRDVNAPADTKVLESAEYIYDNSIDVALDSKGCKLAANTIWNLMQEKRYSAKSWSKHELRPKTTDDNTVDFIFTMHLLDFSFWSEKGPDERFAVEYKDKKWTGYWSIVAALQRALDEGGAAYIPITSSDFWQDENECTTERLRHVFRSATDEEMPLSDERLSCLRDAGQVLYERFDCKFRNCINEANGSAAALVNLLAESFPHFQDEFTFEYKKVRFYKRAQNIVADLWACFDGEGYGRFSDIDKITVFADHRIPQMLHMLGCLRYSPPLEHHIRRLKPISSGHTWELQLRGCSIWCVELIRREIARQHPEATVNAVLIGFFLYDTMKEREDSGEETVPHHRTRSIWY